MRDPRMVGQGSAFTSPRRGERLALSIGRAGEPRPATKGNADHQSTHRAQSRVRVTQALGRVRQAARQRKKEQFTALLHHISVDTLRTALRA
jgi:RNA-directed DNA polymerase